MKKSAIFLILMVFSMMAFSQSIKLFYNNEQLGDTLNVTNLRLNDENNVNINVQNNTNDSLYITVHKEVISEVDGSFNTFCLGVCYDPSVTTSTRTLDLAAGETSTGDQFHCVYFVPSESYGITTVKYSFYDERINEPAKVLVVNYISEDPDGIEDAPVVMRSFNAYPNPATSNVTVQYEVANRSAGDNVRINITSLVGNKVCSVPVSNASGKANLDLSNLVAGIYFYSLEVNGKILSTKKLIVK